MSEPKIGTNPTTVFGPIPDFTGKETSNANETDPVQNLKTQKKEAIEKLEQNKEFLIAANSIVDSYSPPVHHRMKTLERALVLTNLGFSAENTTHEGWRIAEYAKILDETILDTIDEGKNIFFKEPFPEEIRSIISALKIADISPTENKQAIWNLKEGESYVIKGGHTNHAMIYRFKREKDSTYSIHIYNAQRGSDEEQGGEVLEGFKSRAHPYFCYKGVTHQDLFFNEGINDPSSFLTNLHSLKKNTKETTYEDVTTCFQNITHRQVKDTGQLPRLFISTQQSGNCAVKSVNCLLLDLLEEAFPNEGMKYFKLFSFDNRLIQILNLYKEYERNKNNLSNDQKLRLVFEMKESLQGFLQNLYRNYKTTEWVDFKTFRVACSTCFDLMERVNGLNEDCIKESKKIEITLKKAKGIERNLLKPAYLGDKEITQASSSSKIATPPPSWGTLEQTIDLLFDIEVFDNPLEQLLSIETSFREMSSLKAMPSNITLEQALRLQTKLIDLQKKYHDSLDAKYSSGGMASLSEQNTVMEFVAFSYLLATKADKYEIVGSFSVYSDHFMNLINKNPLNSTADQKIFEQRKSLENFFKTDKKQICSFDPKVSWKESFDLSMYEQYATQSKQVNQYFDDKLKSGSINGMRLTDIHQKDSKNGKKALYRLHFYHLDESIEELRPLNLLKKSVFYSLEIFSKKANQKNNEITEKLSLNFNSNTEVAVDDVLTNSQAVIFQNRGNTYIDRDTYESKNPKINKFNAIQKQISKNSENAVICSKGVPNSEKNISLALAHPELQVEILLREFIDNKTPFSDPDSREFFNMAFFKTVETPNGLISPIQDYLKNPASLKKLEEIFKGHLEVFNEDNDKAKRLKNILFTVNLYGKILSYANQNQHPDPNFIRSINMLLGDELKKDYPENLKKEIHLSKCGLFLNQINFNQVDPELAGSAFASYYYLKQLIPQNKELEDVSYLEDCHGRFNDLKIEVLRSSNLDHSKLGNHIISLFIPNIHEVQWERREERLIGTGGGHTFEIDLKSIRIVIDGCEIIQDVIKIDRDSDDYRRLLGNRKNTQTTQTEDKHSVNFYFEDSVWGSLRIIQDKNDSKSQLFERKINNKWYQYLPKSQSLLDGLSINEALLNGNAIWFGVNDLKECFIADLRTGNEIARFHGQHLINSSGYRFKQVKSLSFSNFDDVNQMNYWKSNTDSKIEFPRFINEKGEVLNFSKEEKSIRWTFDNNPHFFLVDRQIPGFKVDRGLVLQNDRGELKILVPQAEVLAKGYTPIANVKVPDGFDNQKASLEYFEYDCIPNPELDSGFSLKGKTDESKIFLAHLYLAQKDYISAKNTLKTISKSGGLSEKANQLIETLLESSDKLHDLSPNACGVRLYAYYLFCKKNRSFDEWSHGLPEYEKYIRGSNKLSDALILDRDEELFIIDQIKISKIVIDRKEKILTETPSPTRYELIKEKGRERETGIIDKALSKIFADFFTGSLKASLNNVMDSKGYPGSKLVKEWYETLRKASSIYSPEVLNIFYQLNTAHIKFKEVADNQIQFLYHCLSEKNKGNLLPELPSPSNPNIQSFNFLVSKNHNTPDLQQTTSKNRKSDNYLLPIHISMNAPSRLTPHMADTSIRLDQDQFFYNLKEKYLINGEKDDLPESSPSDDSLLGRHYEEVQEDKRIASHENKSVFQSKADYNQLKNELENELKAGQQKEKELKGLIQRMAFQSSMDPKQLFEHNAQTLGRAKKAIEFNLILKIACHENAINEFQKMNPAISEEEARNLQILCVSYMTEVTHIQHIKRVLEPLVKKSKAPADYKKVAETLGELRSYSPRHKPFALYFEYLSGMRVRTKQADIVDLIYDVLLSINDVDKIGKIFQLIMGGGKTSTIISMILELISDEGFIPIILSHPSQITSLKSNLAGFQSKRFNKDVYEIAFSMKELGEEKNLDSIIQILKDSKKNRCPIIMSTSLPQFIELQFITLISAPRSSTGMIEKLQTILKIFKNESVSIYDECHLNLSILMDVIVPSGTKKCLQPNRIDLVKEIYVKLLNSNLAPLILKSKDAPAEDLSKESLGEISAFLAEEFSKSTVLNIPENEKEAFKRYVNGSISVEDQELADDYSSDLSRCSNESKENIEFLRSLASLVASPNLEAQEMAHLIALSSMLRQILQTSLGRTYNRNYGRDLESDDGRVIPYLAVDTPASTEFGNPYLALAYHFQSAINQEISKGEIKFLASKMLESAQYFSQKSKTPVSSQLEAQDFEDLTGISLLEIDDEAKLEKAFHYINDPKHIERRLNFEAEVAPFHVTYNTENISSTAINNVSQFNKSFACSGTIGEPEVYHRRFQNPRLDKAAQGAILNQLDLREKKLGSIIHETDSKSLQSFLEVISNHPNKKNLRAVVDAGGFSTDSNSAQQAKEFLTFFNNEKDNGGPPIKGIVYVHKFSKEEAKVRGVNECFAILFDPMEEPSYLLNPQLDLKNAIKSKAGERDVNPHDFLYLFDELRATGTDVETMSQALFLITVDPKMSMQTGLQSTLRAREFFDQQQVEYVVTSRGRNQMHNNAKTMEDLERTWSDNEAILIREQLDRARINQVDDVVRCYIMEYLINLPIEQIKEEGNRYREFLLQEFEDRPYFQYGRIPKNKPSSEVLSEYIDNMLRTIQSTDPDFKFLPQIIKELDQLKERFKKIPEDEKMVQGSSQNLNATVQTTAQKNQTIQLQSEVKKNVDVNKELLSQIDKQKQDFSTATAKNQNEFKINLDDPIPQQVMQISASLQDVFRADESFRNFVLCFSPKLRCSNNFLLTSSHDSLVGLSTKQVNFLYIHPETFELVVLSLAEAICLKNSIKNPEKEGWLIDIKGEGVGPGSTTRPVPLERIKEALWSAQFFDGNPELFEKDFDLANAMISKNREEMKKYFELKSLHTHTPKFSEFFINTSPVYQFLSRRKKTADIKLDSVWDYRANQVNRLTTPEQINALPKSLINSIKPAQLKGVADNRIQDLENPELIRALPQNRLMMLGVGGVKHLSQKQISSINDFQTNLSIIKFFNQSQMNELNLDMKELLKNYLAETPITQLDNLLLKWVNEDRINEIPYPKLWSLLPNQWGSLSSDQIRNLPPPPKNFEEKEVKPFIQNLNANYVLNLDPVFLNYISKDQLNKIDPHEVGILESLKDDLFSKLDKNQINQFSARHIKLIKKLTIEQLAHLPDACLDYTSSDQILKISKDRYNSITKERLAKITNIDLLILLSDFSQEQEEILQNFFASIPPEKIDETLERPELLRFLSIEQIQGIKKPKLLLKLNPEQFDILEESQKQMIKKHIRDTYRTNLDVGSIPDHLIDYLTENQISLISNSFKVLKLSAENFVYARRDLIGSNDEALTELLKKPEHMSKISPDNEFLLQKLPIEGLVHLSEEAFKKVSEIRLIQLMNSDKKIPAHLLLGLNETQAWVAKEKIVELLSSDPTKEGFIEYLKPFHIGYLNEENWKNATISLKDFLLKLPLNLSLGLTRDHIKLIGDEKLGEERVKQMRSDQVKELHHPDDIKWITDEQLKNLTEEEINKLYKRFRRDHVFDAIKDIPLGILSLPFKLIANISILAWKITKITSAHYKEDLLDQSKETFYHSPARSLSTVHLPTNYGKYRLLQIKHQQKKEKKE